MITSPLKPQLFHQLICHVMFEIRDKLDYLIRLRDNSNVEAVARLNTRIAGSTEIFEKWSPILAVTDSLSDAEVLTFINEAIELKIGHDIGWIDLDIHEPHIDTIFKTLVEIYLCDDMGLVADKNCGPFVILNSFGYSTNHEYLEAEDINLVLAYVPGRDHTKTNVQMQSVWSTMNAAEQEKFLVDHNTQLVAVDGFYSSYDGWEIKPELTKARYNIVARIELAKEK